MNDVDEKTVSQEVERSINPLDSDFQHSCLKFVIVFACRFVLEIWVIKTLDVTRNRSGLLIEVMTKISMSCRKP